MSDNGGAMKSEFERGYQLGREDAKALSQPSVTAEREGALEAAAQQASFCLRELLPNNPDAQMTVAMLKNALASRGDSVTVPRDLTKAMLDAGAITYQDRYDIMGAYEATKLAWESMLAARPGGKR